MAAEATTKVLKFGIAGLGIASTQIIPEFVGRSHLAVTAAAAVRRKGLEKFAREFEGETYTSVAEMCQSPNVDAIYVCTPNHLHGEHVITAADNGKHVIVEKPMGLSIDECEAMNAAAERNGVKLLYDHTHSFDYGDAAKWEVPVAPGERGRAAELEELYGAGGWPAEPDLISGRRPGEPQARLPQISKGESMSGLLRRC